MESRNYRNLELWQRAMDLVIECYDAAKKLPAREVYGLVSQIQRAAVSIPANVAEGQGRQHRAEFIQHLSIAKGSLTELETHIQIACRLQYLKEDEERELLTRTAEVGRLLNGLLRFLRSKDSAPTRLSTGNRRPKTDIPCV